MKRLSYGFTLIELMIVVAIIAVLAAVALPAYSSFITRAKLTEAIIALEAVKISLGEAFAQNGMNGVKAFAEAYNDSPSSEKSSKYVGNVSVDAQTGVITVTTAAQNLPGDAVNKTLKYTPYTNNQVLWKNAETPGQLDWVCASNSADTAESRGYEGMELGSLPNKYASLECR